MCAYICVRDRRCELNSPGIYQKLHMCVLHMFISHRDVVGAYSVVWRSQGHEYSVCVCVRTGAYVRATSPCSILALAYGVDEKSICVPVYMYTSVCHRQGMRIIVIILCVYLINSAYAYVHAMSRIGIRFSCSCGTHLYLNVYI